MQVSAEAFSAKVVQVSAGDVFEIAHAGERELVVLYGVDAPSTSVRAGKQAKAFAEQRVLNQTVQVRVVERREGITFVELTLPDGSNLSHLMLRNGLARWDRVSAPEDEGLEALQRLAREEKRGLWYHASLEPEAQAPPPGEPPDAAAVRSRVSRAPSGRGYEILEERVLVDESGVKTLVLRGTGEKQAGYELAAERRRRAEYEARIRRLQEQQQERLRRQAEAQRQARQEQRRLQEQRIEQMQLEQMRLLNRQLQQQQGVNVTVTPLRPPGL
ncbi:MAG: hypothetical protein GWN84_23520 [Gammaproteobacteria bacterium]|nr:hypothetical protein [Gammaproteobacteria bacterium]NIR85577.1 hypothetical protein [Gammaproteobacteria bacterium]NIU06705.1 hypothetical protein [Gammaproteobacteria bacterium]NIX87978.1 hypothetical protein [Gammaproteobacteria bacterium]